MWMEASLKAYSNNLSTPIHLYEINGLMDGWLKKVFTVAFLLKVLEVENYETYIFFFGFTFEIIYFFIQCLNKLLVSKL